jgi:hypothetical protein
MIRCPNVWEERGGLGDMWGRNCLGSQPKGCPGGPCLEREGRYRANNLLYILYLVTFYSYWQSMHVCLPTFSGWINWLLDSITVTDYKMMTNTYSSKSTKSFSFILNISTFLTMCSVPSLSFVSLYLNAISFFIPFTFDHIWLVVSISKHVENQKAYSIPIMGSQCHMQSAWS